ncbi:hypothetical protein LINPERPRIM_LOCUS25329 [Linum perenne]
MLVVVVIVLYLTRIEAQAESLMLIVLVNTLKFRIRFTFFNQQRSNPLKTVDKNRSSGHKPHYSSSTTR